MDRVDPIVEQAADRLRELEPSAVAVVVTGSYARGTADEHSDLDVRATTEGEPHIGYRTWFADRQGQRPLHVSLCARSLVYWLAAREEPAFWTLGFPFVYRAEHVWATPEARKRLGADPSIVRPPGPPQLEALVECAAKLRRAPSEADPVGARLYARKVAELTPCLVTGLNEQIVVHSPREALDGRCRLRRPAARLARYLADGTLERHLGFASG